MKKEKRLAIFGYSGHAKEVSCQMGKQVTFFVDDNYANLDALPISLFNPDNFKIMIAIADSEVRERVVKNLPEDTEFFSFIHPTALLMDDNIQIGEGSFIGAYSILTSNIKLGKHTILNRGNHIGHDCEIGDYFSAMPGAIVSGNVKIGDKVYLGTNSSIREKMNVCSNVTLGMNSCIVKNISEPGVYVGVPSYCL